MSNKIYKVAIVMGSQSDYSTMKFAVNVLKILKIKGEASGLHAYEKLFIYAKYLSNFSKLILGEDPSSITNISVEVFLYISEISLFI